MNYIRKNTLTEFMAKALDNTVKKSGLPSRKAPRLDWDLNTDFDGAVKLQQGGWSERPDLSKLASSIDTSGNAEITVQNTTYDVQGAYVDVATYLEGVPECMVNFTEQPERKVIRIAFNLSTSHAMTSKAFKNRGAVVLAVVRKLIESGYSVELVGFQYCKPSGGNRKAKGIYLQQIVLKESEQIIDEDALAFWCCHPAALRRLGFSAKESMTEEEKQYFGFTPNAGYGVPQSARTNTKVVEELDADCIIDVKSEDFKRAIEEYEHAIKHLNEKL